LVLLNKRANPLARSAIFFALIILSVVFWGIYFKGYKEKKPVVAHKEWANCVQQTADGGYVVAGVIWRLGGWQSSVYLVKADTLGRKLWSKTFGRGDVNYGNSVEQTADSGYVVAGTTWPLGETHSDIYVIRTDAEGNEIWSRTYGGSGKDEGLSVCQATDGGYIIAGQTDSFGQGNDDVYLVKADAKGDSVWSKTFGGKGRDWAASVRQTSDGGYVVAGTTWPFEEKCSDVYLIKTDAHGREIWHETFGGKYGDYGRSVQQTPEGGYVVVGNTWPLGRIGESKIYLLKTDDQGGKVWAKTFGGGGSEYGLSVCHAVDGGYIIAGKTERVGANDDDIYLAKIQADGTQAWSRRLEE
jgi:hypothetical protein